ncbi:M14 family metallopeptidase [Pedobacter sp. MC2016-14]|uniref:M14 metallopeptidase family protein n=1 Tax=Pedobacter sp. MC2016-14 TaxID=2897327 RepID=UPI001E37A0EC|nr:M14 metallopeptidase family protein [Pedobacter sp. MC2016-14]MCD0487391.1 M14 family metallopeptidase [Pedobacter sp. MC2016-14]
MKHLLRLFLLILVPFTSTFAQKKSPDEYLGYALGSHFTPHQRVVDYFKYLSAGEKKIKLVSYGKTYEGRELMVAIVSSAENIEHLEEIRRNNLSLRKAGKTAIDLKKQPAILWLSYNVHGNEASSTETAMKMLFALTTGQEKGINDWIKNTVVVIDPCLNPDGRERYVNFFTGVKGKNPDANPDAREHSEPWPRGRSNHYYYDLNRDWAWQTQVETQQRLALYHQWMPEVHVDFHEQSYNEPYYFAPAAEPVHQDITAFQRAFQVTVGKNNAKYFDENGWQYFTKERFDLLYPSYGDTYPLYNGAIGMTYEQGGINAGLAVVTAAGDTLTLKDRIDHHYTTGIATLETVSSHAHLLLREFKKYFEQSIVSPPGNYESFVVKADNLDKVKKLAELLKRNHIEFAYGGDRTLNGYNFETQKNNTYKIERNDLVVNLHQSAAVLANVLFEPKTFITDSNTYDITAWALPYAYGLTAYANKEAVKGLYRDIEEGKPDVARVKKPYAWILPWNATSDAQILMILQKAGVRVRFAETGFQVEGRDYGQGSLLVYRAENEKKIRELPALMESLEKKYHKSFYTIASGFVEKGRDLGTSGYQLLKVAKVGVVSGPDISSQAVGQVWHIFEQELDGKVTLIDVEDLAELDINVINVLILPDGKYPKDLNERLDNWIGRGGKVILMEDAITAVAGKKPFEIKKKEPSKKEEKENVAVYSNKERDDFAEAIPGAIYKVNLDKSHPLTFGLGKYYYTLKTDDKIYEPLTKGYNVGVLKSDSFMAGIVGKNVQSRLNTGLLFGVQSYGKGTIIYLAPDVLFRSFWENGKGLFMNAVFLVN